MSDAISGVALSGRPQPSLRRLREFGLIVGCALLVLGVVLLPRPNGMIAIGLAVALIGAGVLRPSVLHYVYRAWMKLAELLSAVMTPVMLGIMFFGVFTPIGIVRRLMGKDELLKHRREDASSWDAYSPRQHRTDHFKKMF